MKRLAAVLLVLMLAGAAAAQGVIYKDGQKIPAPNSTKVEGSPVGGIVESDTSFKVFRFDADGNVMTSDATGPTSFRVWYPNLLVTRLTAGNTDSTAVIDVTGARLINLYLLGTTDSLSCSALWGIQVRAHATANADTTSAFPFAMWGSMGSAAAASYSDTIGTLAYSNAYAATVLTPQIDELLYVSPNVARGGFHRGRCVTLLNRAGIPFTASKLSLRVRCLQVYGDSTGQTCAPRNLRSSSIRIGLEALR